MPVLRHRNPLFKTLGIDADREYAFGQAARVTRSNQVVIAGSRAATELNPGRSAPSKHGSYWPPYSRISGSARAFAL